jgi:DNA-binding GntR family transcriptional regulator
LHLLETEVSVMSIREQVVADLKTLSDDQLRQVADYLAFVRFQSLRKSTPTISEADLAALYAEFADEDRQLAEEGIAEYAAELSKEDAR